MRVKLFLLIFILLSDRVSSDNSSTEVHARYQRTVVKVPGTKHSYTDCSSSVSLSASEIVGTPVRYQSASTVHCILQLCYWSTVDDNSRRRAGSKDRRFVFILFQE
jgi:hypothetical protein